ncbi:hypothetical protein Tco_1476601 [Tanacetum coccineum]
MFLNIDQLQKQLDNNEFQEIGSMASFKVLETQFQMFIKSKIYLNDEYIVMTRNYFLEYTRLDIPEFRDTLIQNMDYVKKSIEKRALHKMEYDSRVNERLEARRQRKRVFRQQHTEQPESNNEGEVDQNAEQCHDIRPLPAKLTDNMTTKLSDPLLELKNGLSQKETLPHLQMPINAWENRLDTTPKTMSQLLDNRLRLSLKRPRISKPRFASQVDVNNDLSKPVTTHHLPKGRESAPAKPHHMIAPSSSRYSLKYRYIVQSYRGRTQSLVAKKKDISENRASRNFDLMITKCSLNTDSSSAPLPVIVNVKWRLLKITLQAPFLNVQKTFDRSKSSLGHQCQMTSDHKRSERETRIQDTSIEHPRFQSWFQNCSLSKQDQLHQYKRL